MDFAERMLKVANLLIQASVVAKNTGDTVMFDALNVCIVEIHDCINDLLTEAGV
jgi:hypothetical protein